jgi:histone acetyltransferase (RNA polymerase elongator complex component)
MNSQSRVHFFGRYSDIVAAEYLCVISIERIKRECAAHIENQRNHGLLAKNRIRRAAAAFCDSAVYEFGLKLERILAEESARSSKPTEQTVALNEAERFAQQQCNMRGVLIGSIRRRKIYHSSEGAEAGRRMQVVRGLDSQGKPPLQLSGPR